MVNCRSAVKVYEILGINLIADHMNIPCNPHFRFVVKYLYFYVKVTQQTSFESAEPPLSENVEFCLASSQTARLHLAAYADWHPSGRMA